MYVTKDAQSIRKHSIDYNKSDYNISIVISACMFDIYEIYKSGTFDNMPTIC